MLALGVLDSQTSSKKSICIRSILLHPYFTIFSKTRASDKNQTNPAAVLLIAYAIIG
jgi:hypothetical protein